MRAIDIVDSDFIGIAIGLSLIEKETCNGNTDSSCFGFTFV